MIWIGFLLTVIVSFYAKRLKDGLRPHIRWGALQRLGWKQLNIGRKAERHSIWCSLCKRCKSGKRSSASRTYCYFWRDSDRCCLYTSMTVRQFLNGLTTLSREISTGTMVTLGKWLAPSKLLVVEIPVMELLMLI